MCDDEQNYKNDEEKLVISANLWKELRAKFEVDNNDKIDKWVVDFDSVIQSLQFVRFRINRYGRNTHFIRYYFSNNTFRVGKGSKMDTRLASKNIDEVVEYVKK